MMGTGHLARVKTAHGRFLAAALLFCAAAILCACDRAGTGTKGVGTIDEPTASGDFGRYHALVIGIDGYAHWPPLHFAETDAADIGNLLQSEYGFASENVTRLIGRDATRAGILGALRQKLETLGDEDNLLVYYAGHGQLDPLTESGYWVPIDGDLYDDSSWVPFTTITSFLSSANVHAKNVVVITDSCYGGALTRGAPTPGNPRPGGDMDQYMAKLTALAAKRSRQVIASGGYEQVPDKSLFAELLKNTLETNEYPAVDLELLFFSDIYPQLRVGGQQEALMTRVVSGPEANGQFVLVRSSGDAPPPEPAHLTVESEPPGHRVLINGAASGQTPVAKPLPAGDYVVRVEAEGYAPFEQELALAVGEQRTVRAELVREREAEAPPDAVIEVAPAEARVGERFTLTWRTTNARRAAISSLGDVPLSGSRELVASASTTYTLTAEGGDDQRDTASVGVTVKPALPTIDYFVAKPDEIQAGQATTLAWRANDASVTYIEGFGSVAVSGLQEFRPDATTTYTLVAVNELKEAVRAAATIRVNPVPAPDIVSFEVQPSTVTEGSVAVLRWVAHGQQAELTSVGQVPLDGDYKVAPATTTKYTLSVRNAAGVSTQRETTLTVTPGSVPKPPLNLTSNVVQPTRNVGAVIATLAARPYSQGSLAIRQTFLADLDTGSIASDRSSDLWFEAETATARFLHPMNGATLAATGASAAPGLAGCRNAPFGAGRVPVAQLAAGTFICLRTNGGRIAQLEIVQAPGPSPGTLRVNYVTWN